MTITIRYRAVDGAEEERRCRTVEEARRFARERVGERPEEGVGNAVSADGAGRITWEGCTFSDLFAPRDQAERKATVAAIQEHILGVLADGPKTFWCMSPARASRSDVQAAWHSLQVGGQIECRHTAACFGGEEPLWQLAVPLGERRYEGEGGEIYALREAVTLALPAEEAQLRRMDAGTTVFAGGEQIKRIK